jgi:hypothetical protein
MASQRGYDFSKVPRCDQGLKDSVILRVNSRHTWFTSVSELLQICNEAAARREMTVNPGERVPW